LQNLSGEMKKRRDHTHGSDELCVNINFSKLTTTPYQTTSAFGEGENAGGRETGCPDEAAQAV
jgi:hypothetical protein